MDSCNHEEGKSSHSRRERSGLTARGKLYAEPTRQRANSLDERTISTYMGYRNGALPSGVGPVDTFIISRLNDSSSYFFSWFCKRYRIRLGASAKDQPGRKAQFHPCPICLDACTKSIELQCGHAFCRSCLAKSAANNMNACALCRREQVINPELLRARFDEQRMLNLAQRLALPPPTRTCTTSMGTAAGVLGCKRDISDAPSCAVSESERKSGEVGNEEMATDSPINVGPSSDHLLYGPSSNVGAIPIDDLRLRWKCIGEHLATSPSAETVGATSAMELRSYWRRLKCRALATMTGERNLGEYVGNPPQVSCYEDVRGRSAIDGHLEVENFEGRTSFETLNSPCAGGSSLDELSARWGSLMKLCSAGSAIHGQGVHQRYPSTSTICEMDWIQLHAEQSVPVKGSFDSVFDISVHAAYVDDVGSLSNVHLRKRWAEAFGPIDKGGDVGELEVHQLSTRLGLAMESQSIGALSPYSLKERWNALRSGVLESESCPELIQNDRKIM